MPSQMEDALHDTALKIIRGVGRAINELGKLKQSNPELTPEITTLTEEVVGITVLAHDLVTLQRISGQPLPADSQMN